MVPILSDGLSFSFGGYLALRDAFSPGASGRSARVRHLGRGVSRLADSASGSRPLRRWRWRGGLARSAAAARWLDLRLGWRRAIFWRPATATRRLDIMACCARLQGTVRAGIGRGQEHRVLRHALKEIEIRLDDDQPSLADCHRFDLAVGDELVDLGLAQARRRGKWPDRHRY